MYNVVVKVFQERLLTYSKYGISCFQKRVDAYAYATAYSFLPFSVSSSYYLSPLLLSNSRTSYWDIIHMYRVMLKLLYNFII